MYGELNTGAYSRGARTRHGIPNPAPAALAPVMASPILLAADRLESPLVAGIILLRSTRASLALCDEWIRRMQKEMVEKPPPTGGFLQW